MTARINFSDYGYSCRKRLTKRENFLYCMDEITQRKRAKIKRWRKLDPEVMFSIVVYADMRGILSSRAIEEVCKTDIRFMWLLQYEPAPDHTTTARSLEKTWTDVQKGFFTNLFKSFRKSARLNSDQCSLTEQKLKQIQTSTDKGILLRMNRSI